MLGVTSNALRNQVVNNEGIYRFVFKYDFQDLDKTWLPIKTMLKVLVQAVSRKPMDKSQ